MHPSRIHALGVAAVLSVISFVSVPNGTMRATPFPPPTMDVVATVRSPGTLDAHPVTTSSAAGCVSATGTGGACTIGTALDGATGVSSSPDGANVYVAAETSRSVSVFSRGQGSGAIAQLTGTDGCVSASGTGGACAKGTALVGPRSLGLSPDGKSLYFPATTAAAVAVFSRDTTTGALRQLAGTNGCISESGTNGSCAVGKALAGARSAAVSSDGRSVYVASYFADAVAVFSRNRTTGALTQLAGRAGCVSETGTSGACHDGAGLDGARTVVVSPDDRTVYVASEASGAVSIFARDPTTGALTQLAGLKGCVSQTGTSGACTKGRALAGAGGIAVSPDGDHVYAASMGSDAVAAFSRDPSTGALTQLTGRSGCVSQTGSGGSCTDGKALDRARSVAISPDGSSVYIAAEASDAVAVFSRNPTTGALAQRTGTGGCVSNTGSSGACADGTALDGPRAVSVSPDGKNVYVASFWSSAVSIFARDLTTGSLTQL